MLVPLQEIFLCGGHQIEIVPSVVLVPATMDCRTTIFNVYKLRKMSFEFIYVFLLRRDAL